MENSFYSRVDHKIVEVTHLVGNNYSLTIIDVIFLLFVFTVFKFDFVALRYTFVLIHINIVLRHMLQKQVASNEQ